MSINSINNFKNKSFFNNGRKTFFKPISSYELLNVNKIKLKQKLSLNLNNKNFNEFKNKKNFIHKIENSDRFIPRSISPNLKCELSPTKTKSTIKENDNDYQKLILNNLIKDSSPNESELNNYVNIKRGNIKKRAILTKIFCIFSLFFSIFYFIRTRYYFPLISIFI